jgi:hypothetical protein
MRAVPALLLLLMAGLSGCAEETPAKGPTDASQVLGVPPFNFTVPAEPVTLDVAFDAQGCHAGQLWVDVSSSLVQQPPGFEPAPAKRLVQRGVTSDGLASLETFVCDSHSLGPGPLAFGGYLLYVEPPPFGEGLEEAATNWYVYAMYTDTAPLLSVLTSVNATVGRGTATNSVTAAPYTKSAGQAADESGPIFSYETTSVLTKTNGPSTRRIWHFVPEGLLRIDLSYQAEITDGSGSCQIRDGSPITQAQVGCGANDVLAGLSWNQASWTGRMVLMSMDR